MASLLGVIVFCLSLEISSEVTFLLGVTVFLVEVACSTKNTCVKGTGTEGACITDTYVRRTYIGGAYTSSIYAKSAFTGVASDKSTCVEIFCAIERSKMHLQSFQIFEVRGSA